MAMSTTNGIRMLAVTLRSQLSLATMEDIMLLRLKLWLDERVRLLNEVLSEETDG